MCKTHRIKTDEKWKDSLLDGSKPFEIRFNDRNYQKGDFLEMEIYEGNYTLVPRVIINAEVGCVTSFQQKEGYVVFGLLDVHEMTEDELEKTR